MAFHLDQIQIFFQEQPCVVVSLIAGIILILYIQGQFTIRNLRREEEKLQHDVAFLTLEKEEEEEDRTHLIEEIYNLTQRVATLRERNMVDASEENNQLFHDVALLTLENKDFEERNEHLEREKSNLLQSIAQMSDKKLPETSEESLQLWQNYAALLDENDSLKMNYENLKRQQDQVLQHHKNLDKSQQQKQCPIS